LQDQNPSSPFDDPKKSLTYALYYQHKYTLNVTDSTQPLLRGCPLAKRINFLVPKLDKKMKRNEIKWNEKKSAINTLIPEFTRIYPFPSSLYVQAKFLPSVLHRIERLLVARDIRLAVAKHASWEAALATDIKPIPSGLFF
jgi:endoribonuclease Dicer